MAHKKSFQERYQENDTPWEINRADHNLISTVIKTQISPGRALDLGCSTGDNTIWLAQHGFEAEGWDISKTAISQARCKAESQKVNCQFQQIDLLQDDLKPEQFQFIFDRGCFHTIAHSESGPAFVKKLAALLVNDGIWLSLSGNADEIRTDEGPPQLSAQLISSLVEPYLEILSIESTLFDSDMTIPPRGWLCRMRKRCR